MRGAWDATQQVKRLYDTHYNSEALHNIPALYCRILFLLYILVIWLPVSAFAVSIVVTVKGLESELKENVLARLELYLHRENPRLTVHDVQRLHRQAEEDIRSALAPYGFYDPKISATLSRKDDEFQAEYTVTHGEPIRVSGLDLQITGAGSDMFETVLSRFPLQVGDILNQGEYEEGKKFITMAAIRRGFMKANFVVRELRIHRREKTAEIHLTLDTGPQFVFGETTFQHDYLRPELLHRYLPYQPGDPYRPAKLIELQKLLYRTEYFSRVAVDGQLDAAEDHTVPVNVRLTTPDLLNRYSVGLGYATDTGARVRLEWWNRLLNTRGHQMGASVQASQYDSNLGLNYTVPWRDPKKDRMAYNLAYHDQTWEDTDTKLFTAGVQLEHRGELIRHSGSVEFRNEDYSVGVTSGSSALFVPTYTGTVVWADDLLNTKYGIDLSLSVSGANEYLASDASFVKTVLDGKVILSFLPGWRFIGRGSLGAAFVDAIDDLPPSLRFYAGGDQSIRGYGYKELGTTDASGAVVGGRYLVVGSGEIEKNLTENWSCAAFWDVGNAIDDLSLDFKQGIGAGVRYRLPFGQIRLDVASAISKDGDPLRLHLTVGADL